MKTKSKLIEILAPFFVAFGITLLILSCTYLSKRFGINNLHEILYFIPKWVIIFVGYANVITFIAVFFAGFFTLGRKGALGMADRLRDYGIYKYVRNPMYADISFTFFGLGLIFSNTGISVVGILWLIICFFQCRWEERYLANKFGAGYLEYKNNTPLFIPDFERMIRDLAGHLKK